MPRTDTQDRFAKVASVMFLANINIDGRAGNNLDAQRDGLELYWHEPTGGVIVTQDRKQHYVAPSAIMSVTFEDNVVQAVIWTGMASDAPASSHESAPNHEPAHGTLADKVLEEFQEHKEATPQPKPKREHKAK